jgi:hypothetical protein
MTPQKPLVNMFREWNLAEGVACHIKRAKDMLTAWRMLNTVYDDAPARTIDWALEDGGTSEPQEEERAEDSESEAVSQELLARGAAAFRIVDAEIARPVVEAANGPQEKHVFIYTLHGIRRLKRLWASGKEPELTVVSHEAAQRYGLRADSRRQATWITGPTGVTVSLDTDYEMLLLMDDLPGRTKRIFAHGVKSVERFCGMPSEKADEYKIQLGRDHVELLEQLHKEQPHRTGANL